MGSDPENAKIGTPAADGRRWLRTIFAAAVALLVVACAALLWNILVDTGRAERQKLAMHYVAAAVQNYVQLHGAWPGSWDDLQHVTPKVGLVEMPRDRAWVQERVEVDFQTPLEEIAGQQVGGFTGYGPTQRAYEDYAGAYESAIEAAREARARPATSRGNAER